MIPEQAYVFLAVFAWFLVVGLSVGMAVLLFLAWARGPK